jgi:hypothetical protein
MISYGTSKIDIFAPLRDKNAEHFWVIYFKRSWDDDLTVIKGI